MKLRGPSKAALIWLFLLGIALTWLAVPAPARAFSIGAGAIWFTEQSPLWKKFDSKASAGFHVRSTFPLLPGWYLTAGMEGLKSENKDFDPRDGSFVPNDPTDDYTPNEIETRKSVRWLNLGVRQDFYREGELGDSMLRACWHSGLSAVLGQLKVKDQAVSFEDSITRPGFMAGLGLEVSDSDTVTGEPAGWALYADAGVRLFPASYEVGDGYDQHLSWGPYAIVGLAYYFRSPDTEEPAE